MNLKQKNSNMSKKCSKSVKNASRCWTAWITVTQRENELADKQQNFKREVQKAAESMLEREKQATATLKQFENARKQAEMLSESFSSSALGIND